MEYKCINVAIYDPTNSIFKAKASDRSRVTYMFCNNCENCEAYKNKRCIMRNGLWGTSCPYGKVESHEGYTRRARGFYKQINDWKNKYPNVGNELRNVDQMFKIGDYVYLPLDYLNNYKNPIVSKFGIKSERLIPIENFTKENIKKLFEYRPLSLMGGEICSYRTKCLPKFAVELKNKYEDIFNDVIIIYPDIKKYINEINYVGKLAKAKTLKPGKVKIGGYVYDWDGKQILANERVLLTMFTGKDDVVSIIPGQDFYVEICDNATVDKNTIFR